MAVEHITNLIRESIQPLIGFKRESEERAHGRFAWLFSFKMYTAMGAVAAVIAVFVIVTREKEPPRIVNVPEAQVWRSLEVSGLSPSGPLATAPNRMQWSPFKGAASYEVRILAVDETLIWQGSSQTTSIALPLEIRTRLTSRRTFLWQVTALDSAGRRLSASNLQRIHIE